MQKIITNGIIVLEEQMLQAHDVVIENGRITGIRRTGDADKTGSREIYDACLLYTSGLAAAVSARNAGIESILILERDKDCLLYTSFRLS